MRRAAKSGMDFWSWTRSAVFLLLLLPFLSGCKTKKGTIREESQALSPSLVTNRPPSSFSQLPLSDQRRLEYLYLEANRLKMEDNHAAAFDLFEHCLEIDPDIPEVLYSLAIYRQLMRQDTTAVRLLHRAAELDPLNTYYLEALASYYLDHRRVEDALPHLEQLAKLQPRRSDVLSQLVNSYSSLSRPTDAIRVLDRIELLEGKMASVSYRKFGLYKELGDEKKAFAELEALCNEYPHEMSYRLAIGNQLLQANRFDEAQKVYDQVRQIDPDNDALKLSMLELYRQTSDDARYEQMRDSLLFSEHTAPQMRMVLLRNYISDEMANDITGRQRVQSAFQHLRQQMPRDLDLLQLQAAYLATYERANDSAFVAVMDRVNELEPANTQALFYLIQYYGEHKQFQRLEDICRRGVLTHPEELVCHFYLGIACYQQEKKAEALKAFQDGIVQKTEESRPTMVAELYSLMGEVLHEMGREEEAFAAYDSCLVYQDDNVGCLNNYAYFLSLRNQQLDKAEEMSYRTIRLEPDNKTYLDTYAWILFMKERYGEAQIYIDRVCPPTATDSALLSDPSLSGVVMEHAGDIAAKNGNAEQALRFWKLAEQAGGTGITALLPKKIKLKKYVNK